LRRTLTPKHASRAALSSHNHSFCNSMHSESRKYCFAISLALSTARRFATILTTAVFASDPCISDSGNRCSRPSCKTLKRGSSLTYYLTLVRAVSGLTWYSNLQWMRRTDRSLHMNWFQLKFKTSSGKSAIISRGESVEHLRNIRTCNRLETLGSRPVNLWPKISPGTGAVAPHS
jgi:hypothetical protein